LGTLQEELRTVLSLKQSNMDSSTFLHEMEQLFDIDAGTLNGNEILSDIESWDSMKALEFIIWSEKVLKKSIDGSKLVSVSRLSDLKQLVDNVGE